MSRLVLLTILLTTLAVSETKPVPDDENAAAKFPTKEDIDECFSGCKTRETMCYNDLTNLSFQETLVCMQANDLCQENCKSQVKLSLKIKRLLTRISKERESRMNLFVKTIFHV